MIDQTKIISAAEKIEADLARWRHETVASRWQLKAALQSSGFLSAVDAHIATLDDFTKLQWAEADVYPRDNDLVTAIGAAVGISATQLDSIFALALTI